MCGICGFTGTLSNQEAVLSQMMTSIRHRGPDGEGTYYKQNITLGFRRLAIVDLTFGNQPMTTIDGRYTVVFNGEIYNYPALRTTLEGLGHHFQTNCDTEVLLHGFEQYGESLVPKLRGMFAFAIWDELSQSLFAARDFFGIKPFYYTQVEGALVFASEIKSILCYPKVARTLNHEAFEQYLSFQYAPLRETMFAGIYKLMPGEQLKHQRHMLTRKRWGSIGLAPDETTSMDTLRERFSGALENSVQAHCMSDVEIGTLLSSGVDSSYLAATQPGKKTFTVGFLGDDSFYNESADAVTLANALGKQPFSRRVTSEEYFDAVQDVQYYMDEPLADPAAVALYFADQLASEQVKVVFSGEGADELFAGYNIYREPHDLLPLKKLPDTVRQFLGNAASKIPFYFKGKNFLMRGSQSLEQRYLGGANIFSYAERQRILKQSTAAPPQTVTEPIWTQNKKLDDISRMQWLDQRLWLVGDILLKGDKMSMAHSVEARVPYLDKEVYQWARILPQQARIQGKSTKHLFREIAHGKMPKQVAEKKKLGFPVPIRVWLREEKYAAQVLQTLQSPTAEQFFCTAELTKLLTEHRSGKRDNSRKIWTVYCFLLWYDVYFEHPRIPVCDAANKDEQAS